MSGSFVNISDFSDVPPDFEMLGDSLLERLEAINAALEKAASNLRITENANNDEDGDFEAEDDEDDAEYAEAYGSSSAELKEYVRKFRDYAKEIKKEAEAYGEKSEASRKQDVIEGEPRVKSPDERGHKMICGCPGCMAFKEFYGIKTVREEQQADAPLSLASKKRTEKYEEKSSRPCGGKLYNQFHGERAGLRGVFGRYTGGFNFGNAGY